MKERLSLVLWLLVIIPVELSGQEILGVQNAVEIGLQNNYAIQIVRNEEQIAENNDALGNAGFLPRLQASANQGGSMTSSQQEYFNGSVNDQSNAISRSSSSGVTLNWTLFDGFQMFATRTKLSELNDLSSREARRVVENTVTDIVNEYYNIVRQLQRLQVRRDALEISRARLEIARSKQELGSGSGLEVMQARADLNADSSALKRQQVSLANAKTALNELLARDLALEFQVVDSIPLQSQMPLADLRERLYRQNSELRQAEIRHRVDQLQLREIQAERYPELSLNLGYDFSRSRSESGFLKSNRSTGYNVGLSATVSLFNGFNVNRRVQNAHIRAQNSQYRLLDVRNRLESRLRQVYERYQSSLELVELERENVGVARQTVEIAREKYQLGTITPLELREAQNAFIEAENRLVDARYEAKSAELQLLQLSGQILGAARR